VKECPFCYTPVSGDTKVCPKCGRQLDQWRTGFFAKPDLPARQVTIVWVVVAAVLFLLAFSLSRSCRRYRATRPSSSAQRP
jgi:hypothetical protein